MASDSVFFSISRSELNELEHRAHLCSVLQLIVILLLSFGIVSLINIEPLAKSRGFTGPKLFDDFLDFSQPAHVIVVILAVLFIFAKITNESVSFRHCIFIFCAELSRLTSD